MPTVGSTAAAEDFEETVAQVMSANDLNLNQSNDTAAESLHYSGGVGASGASGSKEVRLKLIG